MNDEVRERFKRIAKKYDFMNHFLSLNADKKWRAEAAKETLLPKSAYRVLDLGTGTGDLAIEIRKFSDTHGKHATIEATDFTPEMITLAKNKAGRLRISGIDFKIGDAVRTGYPNNSFDVITCGFLLRSLHQQLGAYLNETYRILRKGGKLVVLDLAAPDDENQLKFYSRYSYWIRFVSLFTDPEAYGWLVDSMNSFDKKDLLRKMETVGFKNVKMRPLSSGIAYLVTGEKS